MERIHVVKRGDQESVLCERVVVPLSVFLDGCVFVCLLIDVSPVALLVVSMCHNVSVVPLN